MGTAAGLVSPGGGGGRTGDGGLTVYGLVSGIAGRVGLDGVPLAGRGCIY